MRENLIGYLLEALDPAERQLLEVQLEQDPQLRTELHLMRRSLEPLATDEGHYDPPEGLAQRTCEYVVACAMATTPAPAPAPLPSRWTLHDFAVAAVIFVAASMLFFPALNHSRFSARLLSCQNNLRQLGVALTQYSMRHDGMFPSLSTAGNLSVAGVYAPKLLSDGLLTDSSAVVCPSSTLAGDSHSFRVPTLDEINQARGAQLAELHQRLGGSYGYNLGYISDGRYQSTKNLGRSTFAMMADAPSHDLSLRASANHGGRGENVLFEDGHVNYLTNCRAAECNGDDIFLNEQGQAAAGSHRDDAVIGASFVRPLPVPLDE